MKVDSEHGIDDILEVVWVSDTERSELKQYVAFLPIVNLSNTSAELL